MPFLLAEILNFQGSTHRIGVGSFSNYFEIHQKEVWSNWNYPGETKKHSLLKGLY